MAIRAQVWPGPGRASHARPTVAAPETESRPLPRATGGGQAVPPPELAAAALWFSPARPGFLCEWVSGCGGQLAGLAECTLLCGI